MYRCAVSHRFIYPFGFLSFRLLTWHCVRLPAKTPKAQLRSAWISYSRAHNSGSRAAHESSARSTQPTANMAGNTAWQSGLCGCLSDCGVCKSSGCYTCEFELFSSLCWCWLKLCRFVQVAMACGACRACMGIMCPSTRTPACAGRAACTSCAPSVLAVSAGQKKPDCTMYN